MIKLFLKKWIRLKDFKKISTRDVLLGQNLKAKFKTNKIYPIKEKCKLLVDANL